MSDVHINIALSKSKRHALILVWIHLILLVLIFAMPLAIQSRLLLLLCLTANAYWVFSDLHKLGKITRLMIDDNQLAMVRNERRCEVEQMKPVFITDWLMIVKISANGKNYRLSLWRDSADTEQLRQLRVWLLCGRWRG